MSDHSLILNEKTQILKQNISIITTKRVNISKERMIPMNSVEKTRWILILSNLELKDFYNIASVCKNCNIYLILLSFINSKKKKVFFILKEEEKFWNLVCMNHNIDTNSKQDSWKRHFLLLYSLGWDESKFGDIFQVDPENKSILIDQNQETVWKMAITKNHLMEGFLYPFILLKTDFG